MLRSFSCGGGVNAQPVNNVFGDVVMPPPEMASLGKFTDVQVGMHTGTPAINVPIYSLQDGAVSVPISLSYHASGVRVGEPAGMTGLGWALSAGGRIMRTVVGKPDEGPNGYLTRGTQYSTVPQMSALYPIIPGSSEHESVTQVASGLYDGEADVFSFDFAGYAGKFHFDSDGSIVLVPKQNLKIEPTFGNSLSDLYRLKGFTITTPDGNKYFFGIDPDAPSATPVSEIIFSAYLGEATEMLSGWMLTKVRSFDYTQGTGRGTQVTFEYENEQYGYKNLGSCNSTRMFVIGMCGYETYFKARTKRIRFITSSNNEKVSFAYGSNREDLRYYNETSPGTTHAKSLASIQVQDNGVLCKNFNFSYSYWIDNSTHAIGQPEDKRLRLDRIQEVSCDGSIEIPPYIFSYIGENFLPNRMSKAIDHWGFYNGADQNNDNSGLNLPLIEEYTTYIGEPRQNPATGVWQYPGDPVLISFPGQSDRSTHEVPMLLGTLNKITYPTGGEHEFEYEANDYRGRVTEVITTPVLTYLQNYPAGICGTFSGGAQPFSITFTSDQINELEYALKYRKAQGCSNNPNGSLEIRVFRLDPPNAPVQIASSGVYNATNNEEQIRSGMLKNLFPQLQAGQTYRFDFYVSFIAVDFKILERSESISEQNIKVGGLRVKKIQIKDGLDEENTIVKTYRYQISEEPTNPSSGILYNKPRYWLFLDNYPVISSAGPPYIPVWNAYFNTTVFFDNSIVPLSGFQGNHIGYARVIEDHEGNGWKEFKFFTEDEDIDPSFSYDMPNYPYPPEQLRVIFGNEKESSSFKETGEKIESLKQGALEAPYTFSNGTMLKSTYRPVAVEGPNGSQGLSTAAMWYVYKIRNRIPYLVDVSEYDLDGVVKTTTYEYNGINLTDPLLRHYFPTAVQFNNSDGKQYRTETFYAPEMGESALTNRYMIGIPVKETKLVNGNIVGGYRKAYNGDAYPIRYYEILQGGGELQRGEITSYNAQGFPNNFIPMGFSQVNYQWGANRMLTRQDFLNWRKSWDHYNQTTGGGKTRFLKEATDIDGLSTQYQYDQLGRLIRMSSRNNNIVTQYFYNYGGPNSVVSVTEYTDAPTQTIEKQFDGLGRPITTIHNGVKKEEIFYDQYNRVEYQTYLPGNYTTYAYEPSPLNRAIRETYPDGNAQTMEYGREGNYFSMTATNERGFKGCGSNLMYN